MCQKFSFYPFMCIKVEKYKIYHTFSGCKNMRVEPDVGNSLHIYLNLTYFILIFIYISHARSLSNNLYITLDSSLSLIYSTKNSTKSINYLHHLQ